MKFLVVAYITSDHTLSQTSAACLNWTDPCLDVVLISVDSLSSKLVLDVFHWGHRFSSSHAIFFWYFHYYIVWSGFFKPMFCLQNPSRHSSPITPALLMVTPVTSPLFMFKSQRYVGEIPFFVGSIQFLTGEILLNWLVKSPRFCWWNHHFA